MQKRIQQTGLALIAACLLAACGLSGKKETVDHGSAPSEVVRTVGTVRHADGCGYYIEVIKGDLSRSLYAVNLDARYHVEGTRLKFLWEKAKAKPPKECPNFEPVTISEVTPLR